MSSTVTATILAAAGAGAAAVVTIGTGIGGAVTADEPVVAAAAAGADSASIAEALRVPRNFYFVRAQYTDDGVYPGWKDWSTDFPKAERQFLVVLQRLAGLDAYEREQPVRLDDRMLRRFPFLYAVEVGRMKLRADEVAGLRSYLEAGGFMVADDFWGTGELRSFEAQMRQVFPEYSLVEIPTTHPLFHAYYDVDEVVQVPNVGQGVMGGPTHESDGRVPKVLGIFDHAGRLLVVANWNTDLGDGWEWAEHPDYPLRYSTYSYRMGVNFIVYAMSH